MKRTSVTRPPRTQRDGFDDPEPATLPRYDLPDARLHRVRRLAWLLDRSIPIGGGRRIGLDPLIGLLPGGGDAAGLLLSLYIVFEGARLGLPFRVLSRMVGHAALEAVVGTVPVFGDVFDAFYKANTRNVRLIQEHYRPERPDRRVGRIALGIGLLALVLIAVVLTLASLAVVGLYHLLQTA